MIKIKRGDRKTEFTLSVILVVLVAMFSAQLSPNTVGMVTGPNPNPGDIGTCWRTDSPLNTYETAYVPCCESPLNNLKWIGDDGVEQFC
jgi:hypothetical protein